MSVIVVNQRPPREGWVNVAKLGANGRDMYPMPGKVLTFSQGLINPAVSYTVTLKVWAAPASSSQVSGAVIIQGRAYEIGLRAWQTITHAVDTTRPLVITIPSVEYANTLFTLTATDRTIDDANQRPVDVLALDAYVPHPTNALVWDRDRWNRAAFNETIPAPGTLVWDRGRWDRAAWYDETLTHAWRSLLGPTRKVTARRGVSATGPVLKAEAGTLTIEATEDLDPRGIGMVVGTPVRLYHWQRLTSIWVGYVSDIKVTPLKGGGASALITCVDDVAKLAGITRYGARPDGGGPETWRARLTRLTNGLMNCPVSVQATSDEPVCPTVWETSYASHIDALVASTGGAWYASRYGGLRVYATLPAPGTPEIILTDTHADDAAPGFVWHYTQGVAEWQSSALISSIEATTHDASSDPATGEWSANDVTVTVTDATTSAAWAGAKASVDLLTPSTGTATEDAARRLLSRVSTAPLLDKVTVIHTRPGNRGDRLRAALHRASYIDPLQAVTAVQRGERTAMLIAAVEHTMTPETWETRLTLTPAERTK